MAWFREVMSAGVPPRLALMLGHNGISTQNGAGSTQLDATLLQTNFALLSTSPGPGFRLSPATGQAMHVFYNQGPATALLYPADGETINNSPINQPWQVPMGATAFVVPSSRSWMIIIALPAGQSGAPTTIAATGVTISGTNPGTLVINRNAVLPPPVPPAIIWGIGNDSEAIGVSFDTFAAAATIRMRRANGIGVAPLALNTNDVIGNVTWRGYGQTAYGGVAAAAVRAVAQENWTDAAQGTRLELATFTPGTVNQVVQMMIGPGVTIGAPTTAPPGGMQAGDLNVGGRLLANGSPVGGVSEAPTDGRLYGRGSAAWAPVVPAAGGTISGTSPGQLIINRNTALPTPPGTTTTLWTVGAQNEGPAHVADTFGNFASFIMRRANGSVISPSRLNSGDAIGLLAFRGYGTTAYSPTVVRMSALAVENWTDAAQGANLRIETTPAGTVAPVISAVIGPGLTVGNPTVVSGGPQFGDINAQRILVNGVTVGTSTSITDAPADSTTYGRINNNWQRVIPVTGGTITGTSPGNLTINRNAVLPATPVGTNPFFWGVAGNGENPAMVLDSFGSGLNFMMRRANGTAAAPTHIVNADPLGNLAWRGYGVTGYGTATIRLQGVARQDWTDSAMGSMLQLQVTPNGQTALVNEAQFGPGVTIGTPTAIPTGSLTGDLNAQRLFIQGVQVAAGMTEAPNDGQTYGRVSLGWGTVIPTAGGTITGIAPGALTIQRNAAALPPAIGAGGVWINGADTEGPTMVIDAHGSYPAIFLRRANGTGAAPLPVASGDIIGNITWRGYGATAYTNPVGRFQLQAIENFTNTANGTQLNIGTAPAGGVGLTTQLAIGPGVTIGTPSAPGVAMTTGDLNAQRIYVNGVAVGGGVAEAPTDGQIYGRNGSSASWAGVVPIVGGTITGTAPGSLTVNRNTSAMPPSAGPSALMMNFADGENGNITWDGHGTNTNIVFRRANGTGLAPSAINSGDVLGQIIWRGYGATMYQPTSAGRVLMSAIENWSDTVGGTAITLQTQAPGAVGSIVNQAIFGPGMTLFGGPTVPGGITPGDISAKRLFMTNFAQNLGVQIGSAAYQASAAGADPGVGGLIASSQIIVNRNTAAALPAPAISPMGLRLAGADAEAPVIGAEAFGAGGLLLFRRANGGLATALSHINSGDNLGALVWRGYGATNYLAGNNARIGVFASENWTDSASGSQVQVQTCPVGSIATTLQLSIGPAGIVVGAPTGSIPGGQLVGDIHCSRIFCNGVQITVP